MAAPGGRCADAGFGAVSLDFTAIDFETANYQPGSACAVGLVRVRDGRVVHKSGGLIRLPESLGQFADFKTSIHGITAEMVASAPTWRRVAAWIMHYAGQDILISHNAALISAFCGTPALLTKSRGRRRISYARWSWLARPFSCRRIACRSSPLSAASNWPAVIKYSSTPAAQR
jgi:hypothetical protein